MAMGWLKRPRRDVEKEREYQRAYKARMNADPEGRKRMLASKARYRERIKNSGDYEKQKERHRDYVRVKRASAPKELTDRAAATRRGWITRRINNPKIEKKMKPIDVTSGLKYRRKPTAPRGRRSARKKRQKVDCLHQSGFTFKQTAIGMQRKCKVCKTTFTEVAKR